MALEQIEPYYRTGTATFVTGSDEVVFQGAGALEAEVIAGDQLFNAIGQKAPPVKSVSGNIITLERPFRGEAQVDDEYEIYRVPDSVRLENYSQRMVKLLKGGNLVSISDLEFGPDKLIKPRGPGAVTLQDFAPWAQSMLALSGVKDRIPFLNAEDTAALMDAGNLRSLAGLTIAANKLIKGSGDGALATQDFAQWAQSMLALGGAADQIPFLDDENIAALTPFTQAARELLDDPTHTEMVTTLGLLPVQSSVTDATANRLMRTGAFGLGMNPVGTVGTVLSDFADNTVPTGFSTWNTNAPNRPPILANYGTILTFGQSVGSAVNGNWLCRLLAPTNGGLYIQSSVNGGAWTAPQRLDIQSGSNANGQWVRFPDGTQICTISALSAGTTSVSTGQIFCTNPISWSFPANFSVPPVISGGAIRVGGSGVIVGVGDAGGVITTSSITNLRAVSSSSSSECQLWMTATGKWQ